MNNKGLYTEYFKEAKKASEVTIMSMIVIDYLDIIPGNYTSKMSTYTDCIYRYNITDNIDGSVFDIYIDKDDFTLFDKDGNDLLDNMKSAYDNDKEILDKIEAFEKKWDINSNIITKEDESIEL